MLAPKFLAHVNVHVDATQAHGTHAWLVNTGWTGWRNGVGQRMRHPPTLRICNQLICLALILFPLQAHGTHAWLVNTGWTGGRYGVGQRMSIAHTRSIIDAIHSGELEQSEYIETPIFHLKVRLHADHCMMCSGGLVAAGGLGLGKLLNWQVPLLALSCI